MTLHFWSSFFHLPSAGIPSILHHIQSYMVPGLEPQAWYMLNKHSNNWATLPALTYISHMCMCVSGMRMYVQMCVGACVCAGVSVCGCMQRAEVGVICLPWPLVISYIEADALGWPQSWGTPLSAQSTGSTGGWPCPACQSLLWAPEVWTQVLTLANTLLTEPSLQPRNLHFKLVNLDTVFVWLSFSLCDFACWRFNVFFSNKK